MNNLQLLAEIRARYDHHESKLYLKEKYKNSLTFANQGGMWTVTSEFIAFLRTTSTETVILCDNYNNPIEVSVKDLLTQAQSIYDSVMTSWLQEYSTLTKKR